MLVFFRFEALVAVELIPGALAPHVERVQGRLVLRFLHCLQMLLKDRIVEIEPYLRVIVRHGQGGLAFRSGRHQLADGFQTRPSRLPVRRRPSVRAAAFIVGDHGGVAHDPQLGLALFHQHVAATSTNRQGAEESRQAYLRGDWEAVPACHGEAGYWCSRISLTGSSSKTRRSLSIGFFHAERSVGHTLQKGNLGESISKPCDAKIIRSS